MYREYNHFVGDVSKVSYISLEDYKKEIEDIDRELKEIKVTLDYYSDRRKMLEEWKHIVEVKINKWNEDNTCSFCKYCNNLYCSKFNMSVDGGATCSDFEWR
jgi:hypothetical protein